MDWILVLLTAVFIQTSYTDIRYRLIRNYITFPLMAFGLLYNILWGEGILFSLTGMGAVFLMAMVLSFILPSMGMGDVKLIMGLGSLMGYAYALSVYFYATGGFVLFYGIMDKSLATQAGHGLLTLKQVFETGKPVQKDLKEKGRPLAVFISIAGILLYFMENLILL